MTSLNSGSFGRVQPHWKDVCHFWGRPSGEAFFHGMANQAVGFNIGAHASKGRKKEKGGKVMLSLLPQGGGNMEKVVRTFRSHSKKLRRPSTRNSLFEKTMTYFSL